MLFIYYSEYMFIYHIEYVLYTCFTVTFSIPLYLYAPPPSLSLYLSLSLSTGVSLIHWRYVTQRVAVEPVALQRVVVEPMEQPVFVCVNPDVHIPVVSYVALLDRSSSSSMHHLGGDGYPSKRLLTS
jgi:hypothetical protein